MWLSCLLIILCSISMSHNLSVKEGKTIFSKYIKAVRAGKLEEALSYWNHEEREMYGPLGVDWQLPLLTWRADIDISEFTEEIISANKTEDYVKLDVEWRHKSNDEMVRKDHRYFIIEDGKLVCANPSEIHTKDWLKKELNYIVYHVKPEEEPEDIILKEIDEFCEKVSVFLKVSLKRKIHCFKMSSSKEVGEMFNLPPTMGRAYVPGYAVVNMTHFPQYEIMHIFRRELKKGSTATMFFRGLGIYFGGTPFFSPHLCIHWAKQALNKWEVSLDEINEKAYIAESNNRYCCLSGAFVKYLIEEYDIDSFKKVYTECDDWAEFKELVNEIYIQDIDEMEKGWKDWLYSLKIETIEPGINPQATVIFTQQDPKYDDKGDGDYVYPLGREEGICDLTGFKVLADENRVYFELSFRNLANMNAHNKSEELTCYDWGFGDTFSQIVLRTGSESKQTRLEGVDFSEPYNYFISISGSGILLCNHHGIWLDLLRVKSGASIKEGNKMKFSIPMSIIGKPDNSWKYQVLVGCHAGREWMSHGVGYFRKVGNKATKEQGGGGLDSNVNPKVYDILLPEGVDQAKLLSSYDETTEKLVTIQLVGEK